MRQAPSFPDIIDESTRGVVLLVLAVIIVMVWVITLRDEDIPDPPLASPIDGIDEVVNLDQEPSVKWEWPGPDINPTLKLFAKQTLLTISPGIGVVSSTIDCTAWEKEPGAVDCAEAGFPPTIYGLDTETGEELWKKGLRDLFGDDSSDVGNLEVFATNDPDRIVCVSVFPDEDSPIVKITVVNSREGIADRYRSFNFEKETSSHTIHFVAGRVVVSGVLPSGDIYLEAFKLVNGNWEFAWDNSLGLKGHATGAVSVFDDYIVVKPESEPSLFVEGTGNALLYSAETTVFIGKTGDEKKFDNLSEGTGLVRTAQGYLKLNLTSTIAGGKKENSVANVELNSVDVKDLSDMWDNQVHIAALVQWTDNRIVIPGDIVRGLIPIKCTPTDPINKGSVECSYMRLDTSGEHGGEHVWGEATRRYMAQLISLSEETALFWDPEGEQLVWTNWKTGEEVGVYPLTHGVAFTGMAGNSQDYVYLSARDMNAKGEDSPINQVVAVNKSEDKAAWTYDIGTSTQTLDVLGDKLILSDSLYQSISGLF